MEEGKGRRDKRERARRMEEGRKKEGSDGEE